MNSYIQQCSCFFQWLESPRQAVSHHAMLTMQIWLTICPFTRPSERLTGLDNGLRHDVHTLEKDNIDAILHMNCPCNATELCMFIGYMNNYCTCCRFVHISLSQIDLRFDNILHGQTQCRKHLYNAFACDCKSIACPNHNNGSAYTPRRKAGCLLLLQSDDFTSKAILYWNSEYFPSQLLSKNVEVCSSNDIHIFMRHSWCGWVVRPTP